MTAARITEPAAGASVYAGGDQVWSGKIGAFTAKAAMKARNSTMPTVDEKGLSGGQGHEVEGQVARAALVQVHHGQQADEHDRRPEEGVQEELQRRVAAPLVPPAADDEVRRHQGELEEEEEEEEVEGQKAPEATRTRAAASRPRSLGIAPDPPAHQGDREQHPAHQHQEERYPVDTELPRDAEHGDPAVLGHHLEPPVAHPEANGDEHSETEHGHRERDAEHLDEPLARPRQEGHDDRPARRDQHQRGEQREAGPGVGSSQHGRRGRGDPAHEAHPTGQIGEHEGGARGNGEGVVCVRSPSAPGVSVRRCRV